MNRQAIAALFLLVLNTGYFIQALSLPRPFQFGEPGPAFLPLILSSVLFLASGRILYMELRGIAAADETGESTEGVTLVKPVALVLVTAAFVYAFEPVGYWIATLFYTFFVAMLFEFERTSFVRAVAVAAAVAFGTTLAGWLFFVTLFDLFLPSGDLLG